MNELRKMVRLKRKELGLTMEELAKMSNTTKSYIWEIENKEELRPSIKIIASISKALNMSIDEMYYGTSIKNKGL